MNISDSNLFHDDDTKRGLLSNEIESKHTQDRWRQSSLHIGLLYAINVFLLILLALATFAWRVKDPLSILYSPATSAVKYEQRDFVWHFWDKGPYMGYPTDEKDQMWSDLYNFGTSGISNDDAKRMVWDTVPVPGSDSQSLVMLDMWHQLHCLNAVRKAIYPERWPDIWTYKEDGTIDYETVEMKHIDHCIDHIRQSLQCFGDISPTGFFFDPVKGNNPRTEGTHTCKDFSQIKQWALNRQVFNFSMQDVTLAGKLDAHGNVVSHSHDLSHKHDANYNGSDV